MGGGNGNGNGYPGSNGPGYPPGQMSGQMPGQMPGQVQHPQGELIFANKPPTSSKASMVVKSQCY